jgi:sugar transferase (PEP-CTERM/EpsH1 system associated)
MVVAGAETLVAQMVSLMPEFDFSVYVLDEVGPLGEELRARGVPLRLLGRKPGVDWPLAGRLARALREDGIALLHAHQYTPWFYGSVAAALGWGRPRILFTEHGRHFPDSPRAKRILFNKCLTPFTDGFVAVSAFIRDCLRDNEGLDEKRIRVLYNGIDPARFDAHPDRLALRREQGLGENDPVVGTPARFAPVKNHATLLEAFRLVVQRLPEAKLVLAGDGPLRAELQARAHELGIEKSVRFLGVRRDVPALLRTWDVFCLSSLSEGTSVTLLEAMASGLPSVVTAVGGNPEVVRDGETGRLVPSRNAEALASALLDTLTDRAEAQRMGAKGRERVRERFTLSRMLKGYAGLYREILEGGRT